MTHTIPKTQHAIQFVGKDEIVLATDKPVQAVGPRQLLLKVEASGICFSDTKLLHAFDAHPRKGEVTGGLSADELAGIPSYVPGAAPTVPGHEPVARIVAVGDEVTSHRVGERVLVQTDYRHLPTAGSNAAFGYNFEGALQEYVVVDERVVLEPGSGERFLIPVDEEPSASAIALIEPWACVEAAYAWGERREPAADGRLLVVGEPDEWLAGRLPGGAAVVASAAGVPTDGSFDDIVYYGADAGVIEELGPHLAAGGILNVVLNGATIGRPVAIDVGRVHYDLIRYVGTTGSSAADGYARIPGACELRPDDRVAIIGAAGPMGLMHTMRTAVSGVPGVSMDAVDVDDARLAHLAEVVAPFAEARGVPARFLNSTVSPLKEGYTYLAVMVPAPALIAQAVDLAGDGAIVNAFAGFAVGTMAALDLDAVLTRGVYLVGTSGSRIEDMKAMLAKVEAGELDTNVSLDAVCGLAGFRQAIDAVINRTAAGKIMVYPALHDLGMVRLDDLADRLPDVAAALDDGRWTKAAEEALLRGAGH